ncbi:MAG: acyltransferase [Roseivirga sp.]|jgi:peptidoglycan/LPS O-acetylase OafA/YrhL|uniref:acyltransferase family protein n=1 Tax=Roseivirga sp. TaxID=1964215 RepID=UPI001B184EFF|nr:acyltransferase [Roseivirga sp.]MBO6496683.1 acyltransferase [Roseivirga sp.]
MNKENPGVGSAKRTDENQNPRAYLKGINGLRSIFVVPVILLHLIMHFDEYGLDPKLFGDSIIERRLGMAVYGLGVFFGISGFLITYLLRLEKEKRGDISIKRFYWRRALRILPLYYAQIFVCLILYRIFDIEYTNWDLLVYYATYMVNIPYVFGGVLPLLGHYWSLAVEEQFYLFWPWVNKLSNKQLLYACWIFLILLVGLRSVLMYTQPNAIFLLIVDHPWFQCMIVGALFALYYLNYEEKMLKYIGTIYCQAASWIFLVSSLVLYRGFVPFDIELTTAASCLILIGQNAPKVYFNIETPFLNYAGRISYSVYIVHMSVIFLCGELIPWALIGNVLLRYTLSIITVFGFTMLVAHVFHVVIEKPFMKLKEKRFTYVHGMKV